MKWERDSGVYPSFTGTKGEAVMEAGRTSALAQNHQAIKLNHKQSELKE